VANPHIVAYSTGKRPSPIKKIGIIFTESIPFSSIGTVVLGDSPLGVVTGVDANTIGNRAELPNLTVDDRYISGGIAVIINGGFYQGGVRA
jgi:hypothetical protein